MGRETYSEAILNAVGLTLLPVCVLRRSKLYVGEPAIFEHF
jgi:hypothetical protein